MIHCEGLVKIYKVDDLEVVALQGLNFSVQKGEMMAIIGNSGSGKSTLLNILGGLDQPSAGQVRVGDWDLLKVSDKDLVEYKRRTVGFVWQNNARNLIPYLTALENVEIPMMLSGKSDRNKAMELLEAVGLKDRVHSKLHQLSGGEQQRVAISIALINEPQILLADEPTGSVDSATADMILDIFRKFSEELGLTVVIVTHDPSLAKKVDRVIAIRDGMTVTEFLRRKEVGEFDDKDDTHEEFVVLDRVGRLQVPRDYLDQMEIKDRVKMEFDGEKIIIRSP
jgi:putative ABC transport system ATP-binding protein